MPASTLYLSLKAEYFEAIRSGAKIEERPDMPDMPDMKEQTGNEAPRCDRCGAPMTTGLMAAICPRREGCAFWPEDEESQRVLDELFLVEMGWHATQPPENTTEDLT